MGLQQKHSDKPVFYFFYGNTFLQNGFLADWIPLTRQLQSFPKNNSSQDSKNDSSFHQQSLNRTPTQTSCTIRLSKGKSLKITIPLYCLIPQNIGNSMTPVHFPGNQRLVKICVNISAITHPLRAWLPAHVFGRCCRRVPYVARRDAFTAGRFHQQKDGNPKSRKIACRGYCFTTYLIEIYIFFQHKKSMVDKTVEVSNPTFSNEWNRDLLLVVRPKKAEELDMKNPTSRADLPRDAGSIFWGGWVN